MGWWIFGKKKDRALIEKVDLQEERKIIRLDFERKRYEEELKTIAAREELAREKLQTEILEEKLDRQQILDDLNQDDQEAGGAGKFEDQALMMLLSGVFAGKQNQPQNNTLQISPAPAPPAAPLTSVGKENSDQAGGLSFSLDQIQEIYNSLPPVKRALVDRATPEQIRAFLKQNYPTINEDTIKKTIWFIESKQKN